MTTATEIVATWKATPMSLGIADDLRCMAMECQEEGIARADFVAAAVAAGYKKATAGTCWAYVARQAD